MARNLRRYLAGPPPWGSSACCRRRGGRAGRV